MIKHDRLYKTLSSQSLHPFIYNLCESIDSWLASRYCLKFIRNSNELCQADTGNECHAAGNIIVVIGKQLVK